ncbi:MerR family transcriptional regulator [Paenibacillus tarimensis]|uniref:MerR family transcriptional regulator n=1 Tax=Paenibacillus tarimensis TaxID=416012 RepID=UPI001F399B95|nr:MerR family transcriptional regulator [Paenibacillus tarimensis]MCF2944421.1 MerR family transcriptional regulator [Paenibacillus tarimensis]
MMSLTISQVARAANVNIETVKYYEKRGLLPPPERSRSGYRMFSKAAVEDINLIKKAQEIGFTLNEIKHILALVKQNHYFPVDEMQAFASAKINEINEQISRLESFKALLQQAVSQPALSSQRRKQDCPLLNKIRKGDIHG